MVEWFSMSFKVLITSKSLCCRDILMLSISLITNTTSFLIKKSVFIAKTHTQSHFNSLIHIAYKHWCDWTMMAQKPCLWNGESVYSHWPAVNNDPVSSSHGCLVRHCFTTQRIFRRARLVISAGGHLTCLQPPRLRRNVFQLTDLLERVSLVTLTALTCFN